SLNNLFDTGSQELETLLIACERDEFLYLDLWASRSSKLWMDSGWDRQALYSQHVEDKLKFPTVSWAHGIACYVNCCGYPLRFKATGNQSGILSHSKMVFLLLGCLSDGLKFRVASWLDTHHDDDRSSSVTGTWECVYLGLPLGYYEWWICHQYIAFTEVLGHSGLRIYGMPPSTLAWLLKGVGMELVIEDHDLHHRKGYRKSHNYGKQTRVWDTLFGTCHERIEAKNQNVDWDRAVWFPIL
ncbi:hypothetical protein FOC1_g10007914, partial [Fusarium oxysporum f. sp. cubense race 1]